MDGIVTFSAKMTEKRGQSALNVSLTQYKKHHEQILIPNNLGEFGKNFWQKQK